eukprot:SAG31_NODE_5687_length_2379_cov_11.475439_2_plen_170_part_00
MTRSPGPPIPTLRYLVPVVFDISRSCAHVPFPYRSGCHGCHYPDLVLSQVLFLRIPGSKCHHLRNHPPLQCCKYAFHIGRTYCSIMLPTLPGPGPMIDPRSPGKRVSFGQGVRLDIYNYVRKMYSSVRNGLHLLEVLQYQHVVQSLTNTRDTVISLVPFWVPELYPSVI